MESFFVFEVVVVVVMLPNPSNSLVALLIRFFDGLVPLAVPVDGAIDPSALSNEFVLAVGAILLL